MRKIYLSTAQLLRRGLLALFAAVCIHTVSAKELKDYLVVHMQDGSTVSYVLEDAPTVTFGGTSMHIESPSVSDVYEVADVNTFTFEKLAGISTVKSGERRITIRNQQVILEGFTPTAEVRLADVQGHMISHTTVNADKAATLSIDSLTPGVYVIYTTDGKTFKLIKK